MRPDWWKRIERAPSVLRAKRRVRQWLGSEVQSRVEIECRVEEHGGWWICPDLMPRGGVAYCFGLGHDIRLERHLAERFEMDVLGFDPTPSSVAWLGGQELPARFRHVDQGVAGYDGSAFFHGSRSPWGSQSMVREHEEGAGDRVEVRRLPTLLEAHGHNDIHLLKLDVEGVEYEVIRDMIDAGLRPRVVLVEFHHRFPGIGIAATEDALAMLRAHGYGIFHISPSGREHALILRDAA